MRWWIISRRNFTWHVALTRTWISEPSLIVWLWGWVMTVVPYSNKRLSDRHAILIWTSFPPIQWSMTDSSTIVPGTGILWGFSPTWLYVYVSIHWDATRMHLHCNHCQLSLSASVVPYFYGVNIDGERALLVSSLAGTGLIHSSVCCYIVWKQGHACWRLI